MSSMVFYVPGSRSVVDVAHQVEGEGWRGLYSGKHQDALTVDYPGLQVVSVEESVKQIEAACRTAPEQITQDAYEFALEALPPEAWVRKVEAESFHFAEHYSGAITTIYARVGKKYFSFLDVYSLTHDEIMGKVHESLAFAQPGPGPYGRCI
jgi:hypothetical protein